MSRQRGASAQALAAALDISVPTLHRLLKESATTVFAAGKARRTRYALRRALRGNLGDLPLYAVDQKGRAQQLATLTSVAPEGTWMDLSATGWPAPIESRDGWWDGLPYPFYDMRPQGYMGRQFARAEHQQLGVSDDPNDWGDDDILVVLSHAGHDTSGNLILGDRAYERWQRQRCGAPDPIAERDIGAAYQALAENALSVGGAGSSAAGEFPKFTTTRELPGSDTPHVIVKFSGTGESAAVRRWSDLLVCEHLALECVPRMPHAEAARSRIIQYGGRTFLEVERFDRHGNFGRSPLCGLATLNPALLGATMRDWGSLAERLVEARLLSASTARHVEQLWWFGKLIGNTDMHTGNVSFRAGAQLELAPAYDMLPMMYAPLPGGEVPLRNFTPPIPLPAQRESWQVAHGAARTFWEQAACDSRLSDEFRAMCATNRNLLEAAAEHA